MRPPRKGLYGSRRWRELRVSILERDAYTCQHCGLAGLEVDRIRPICKGGAIWEKANLQAMCKGCHSRKTRREQRPPTPGRDAWRTHVRESETAYVSPA